MLQMDRSEYGFLVLSTPVRCVYIPAGFFFSGKMTSLEIFNMYLVIFDINNQYLVRFSQYLIRINQVADFFPHYASLLACGLTPLPPSNASGNPLAWTGWPPLPPFPCKCKVWRFRSTEKKHHVNKCCCFCIISNFKSDLESFTFFYV